MKLLVIDREKEFQERIVTRLKEKYTVDVEVNGADGIYASQVNEYDLVVIESLLPDIDGIEVCRIIRTSNVFTPIIFIFDKVDPMIKVRGLDAGADVTFINSVGYDELEAQARALIRRSGDRITSNIIKAGNLELNIKTKLVMMGGERVILRRKEFDVLEYLLIHKDCVISKEELLEHIWEDGIDIFSNTVEVHIRSLRVRMQNLMGASLIKTIRGFGYKIET